LTDKPIGFLNVYKESGCTSHDVVYRIRRLYGGGKVGHTGTLDPAAEGVLPICVGSATRLAGFLLSADKTYHAWVEPGMITDTQDATGKVISKCDRLSFSEADAREVLRSFVGAYRHRPPMYSAVKVNGKRLYELARAGLSVERAERETHIESISLLQFEPDTRRFLMEVTCSRGTYIRSLCADIGEALGCGACMGALKRTRVGPFEISQSTKINELQKITNEKELAACIISPEVILPYPQTHLNDGERIRRALNGNPISAGDMLNGTITWLYGGAERIGLFAADGEGTLKPLVMCAETSKRDA
jgi:tRNA pseudouridine55 synthase